MQSFNTIANSQLNKQSLSTIGYRTIAGIDHLKADARIDEVSKLGLITDAKYKPYFYKKYYGLGDARFMELANRALSGNQPARLFCKLLGK